MLAVAPGGFEPGIRLPEASVRFAPAALPPGEGVAAPGGRRVPSVLPPTRKEPDLWVLL